MTSPMSFFKPREGKFVLIPHREGMTDISILLSEVYLEF